AALSRNTPADAGRTPPSLTTRRECESLLAGGGNYGGGGFGREGGGVARGGLGCVRDSSGRLRVDDHAGHARAGQRERPRVRPRRCALRRRGRTRRAGLPAPGGG